MANAFYASAPKHIAKGEVVWLASGGSNIKVDLVKSTYTPNLNTDEFHSTVTASAGILGTSANLTLIDAATDGVCDAADSSITPSANGSGIYLVVWKDTGTDATSPLLLLLDTFTGAPFTAVIATPITVTFDNGANKIMKI